MKKLISAIAIGAFAFAGTATQAEARPHGGYGHHAPQSSVYVSGYRYGRPVYTERYFVGYDCHGHPRFAYRTVSAPRSRHYGPQHCDTGYSRYSGHHGYGGGHHGGYYDNHRRSGASVSFSFGR